MSKTVLFMVTENPTVVEKAKQFWEENDVQVQVFSPMQWKDGMENPNFREQISSTVPSLSIGTSPLASVPALPGFEGGNVLKFPTNPPASANVQKMEQMEAHAIENAIHQYKGNLTEAARALGIGRATLYRKVKHYKIDPSASRKRKVKIVAA